MVTNNLTGLSTDTKPYAEKESLFQNLTQAIGTIAQAEMLGPTRARQY